MKRLLVLGLAGTLLAAVAVQFEAHTWKQAQVNSRLASLPVEEAGWKSNAIPVGATEAEDASVAGVLRYDDLFYREYYTPTGIFTVYAVYWSGGKMPVQLVASHTPDRCWTEAGWRCTARRARQLVSLGGIKLRTAEARVFEAPTHEVRHVLFWHLVGNDIYDYGNRFNVVPSVWLWWRDAARQIFERPREQYFVRIASDVPFDRLSDDPALRAVATGLARLGLGE